jgi:putative transposase
MRCIPHRVAEGNVTGTARHVLTFCTFRRRQYFSDSTTVDLVWSQLLRTSTAEQFAILAYCFMPDHLHAVVEGLTRAARLPRFVRLAKQLSGYRYRQLTGRRLWQESYFDRTLRVDEALPDCIYYIIANPVRAGLVTAPTQYPHWGSGKYSREELLEFIAIECLPRV